MKCSCGHEFEPIVQYQHRLICGDCTDPAVVARLLGDEKAPICWTDPPWNVAYGSAFDQQRPDAEKYLGWKNRTILNDNLGDKFPEFVDKFAKIIHDALVPGGILYMAMGAQEWPTVDATLRVNGFHWSSTIIWTKDSLVVSRKDYHTQYEPLWYGWRDDAARVCEVTDRTQSDVWPIPRPKVSELHPTTKPVPLVERSLANSSRLGDLVFEPFAGSGTTCVAAERLGRRSAAIELAPEYAAVVIERLVQTGLEPLLISSA